MPLDNDGRRLVIDGLGHWEGQSMRRAYAVAIGKAVAVAFALAIVAFAVAVAVGLMYRPAVTVAECRAVTVAEADTLRSIGWFANPTDGAERIYSADGRCADVVEGERGE